MEHNIPENTPDEAASNSRIPERLQRKPKTHVVHGLPEGAFCDSLENPRPQRPMLSENFKRHFVWEETETDRRLRVPLMSVPEQDNPSPHGRDSRVHEPDSS